MKAATKLILAALTVFSMATTAQADNADTPSEIPDLIPHAFFLMPGQMSVDLSKYDNIDPTHMVPTLPLQQALAFYDLNKAKITNQNYITVVDFLFKSSKKRMWVIDMKTGKVADYMVAHASKSDPNHDGYPTVFSNTPNSELSSLGFALSGSLYTGKYGRSMYLHGLEATNSNMYARAIVMHGWIVWDGYAYPTAGCLGISKSYVDTLLPKLTGGSLIYTYYNQK